MTKGNEPKKPEQVTPEIEEEPKFEISTEYRFFDETGSGAVPMKKKSKVEPKAAEPEAPKKVVGGGAGMYDKTEKRAKDKEQNDQLKTGSPQKKSKP